MSNSKWNNWIPQIYAFVICFLLDDKKKAHHVCYHAPILLPFGQYNRIFHTVLSSNVASKLAGCNALVQIFVKQILARRHVHVILHLCSHLYRSFVSSLTTPTTPSARFSILDCVQSTKRSIGPAVAVAPAPGQFTANQ